MTESCADPESFVRGGPCLTFFSFILDEGISGTIIGPPAKRHINGVSMGGPMMAQHLMLAQ